MICFDMVCEFNITFQIDSEVNLLMFSHEHLITSTFSGCENDWWLFSCKYYGRVSLLNLHQLFTLFRSVCNRRQSSAIVETCDVFISSANGNANDSRFSGKSWMNILKSIALSTEPCAGPLDVISIDLVSFIATKCLLFGRKEANHWLSAIHFSSVYCRVSCSPWFIAVDFSTIFVGL